MISPLKARGKVQSIPEHDFYNISMRWVLREKRQRADVTKVKEKCMLLKYITIQCTLKTDEAI